VPLSIAMSLGAALLLHSKLGWFKPFFRTAYFAPVVTKAYSVDRISGSHPIDSSETTPMQRMVQGIVPRADVATVPRVRFLRRSRTSESVRRWYRDGAMSWA
jgi:hypothetical protein